MVGRTGSTKKVRIARPFHGNQGPLVQGERDQKQKECIDGDSNPGRVESDWQHLIADDEFWQRLMIPLHYQCLCAKFDLA